MKRMIFSAMIACLAISFAVSASFAAVSGYCVNCHTMHNSQGASEMVFGGASGPQGALVQSTCLGCHTTSGTDPLATPENGSGLYPYVMSTTDGFTDSNCLAGGFFQPTTDGEDNAGKAHSLDSNATPPGYNATPTWYQGTTNGLGCAGVNGCHGSQTIADPMAAIKGGHHGTAEYGYRILAAYNGGVPAAVDGIGAADYEKALIAAVSATAGDRSTTATTHDHNVYKAAAAGTDTISQLCANCHGQFHSETTSGGAWIRHPTDVVLPEDWDPQQDTIVTDLDVKYNPFGFVDTAVETGNKYATCLSCHRAHGSGNADILRFAYTDAESGQQQAGRSGQTPPTIIAYGCLGCHSKQR